MYLCNIAVHNWQTHTPHIYFMRAIKYNLCVYVLETRYIHTYMENRQAKLIYLAMKIAFVPSYTFRKYNKSFSSLKLLVYMRYKIAHQKR